MEFTLRNFRDALALNYYHAYVRERLRYFFLIWHTAWVDAVRERRRQRRQRREQRAAAAAAARAAAEQRERRLEIAEK